MAFMQQQITSKQSWYEVDTTQGTMFLPVDLIGTTPADSDAFADYVEGNVLGWELREDYGARLSAPGYRDCTEWGVFATEKEARDYLEQMYGDNDGEDE